MLKIIGYVISVAENKRTRFHRGKVIHKWTNDEVIDIDIDNIFNPESWRKFLRTFKRPNGKGLQMLTKDGEFIRYEVRFEGTPLYVKEHYGTIGIQNPIQNLFPGAKSKDNPETKDLLTDGWIWKDDLVGRKFREDELRPKKKYK